MKTIRRSRRRLAGTTLVETITALTFTTLIILTGSTCYLMGISTWYRGQSRISAEETSEQAVRTISENLRMAMSVTVNAGGQSLSYRMPTLDGTGTFVQPAIWDGINRSILLSGSNLIIRSDNATDRIICTNVSTLDPLANNAAYTIFVAGTGTITRSLTVEVVSLQTAYNVPNGVYGRHRENIYLRNIPTLTQ